jgi:hypothetical protein
MMPPASVMLPVAGTPGTLPGVPTEAVSRGWLMTRVTSVDAVLADDSLSDAITTTMNVPDSVGVPLTAPDGLMLSPLGSPLALHE